MPTYTDQAGLLLRVKPEVLARLADATGTTTTIRTLAEANTILANAGTIDNITTAISDAAQLMNSYLIGHIDLDDSENQSMLERCNADLALYALYCRQGAPEDQNPKASDRKYWMSWLKGVAAGQLHTKDDPEDQTPRVVNTKAGVDRIFDRSSGGSLENF